ncbi:M23 family metallopeptidase [Leeuwenhoekiella parthenopeia]|uniref:M23 family metallopeptidase n=1 Tax=Leeuwenhoekiella parthenopeia TaxID=2890320 RepID=A0ABS8GS68_9FLAO|nr:M23 family metallopeptidase [Leeuwenhoekiella parthenopeia]MCC4212092.1 M23 family metallopeptidase [Leeuwenhoekiella parthenopeia]
MRNYPIALLMLLAVLFTNGCSKLTRVTDVITQPTAREVYARNFDNDSLPYLNWNRAFSAALQDSLAVDLPYAEQGIFSTQSLPVYAYNLELELGRNYHFEVLTDTLNPLVFIDLYEKTSDSISPFILLEQADYESKSLSFSPKKAGNYKLVLQPQLGAKGKFSMRFSSSPAYAFPVAGLSSKAVQSFWGAARDGGRRSHEGVDIFASRGTPVLAGVDGYVSSTGNRGLGGKQVWLRDGLFGSSLYYAHLDSIIARTGQRVKIGDTLGLVGNTGNARTTPPHLHFGIYRRGSGAINPFPFIQEAQLPGASDASEIPVQVVVKASKANLRLGPSAKAEKATTLSNRDTLTVLGRTNDWLHIKTSENQHAFIHESLVKNQ